MSEFGVRCTMADGEDTLITVDAETPEAALYEVRAHQRLFGPGDPAGEWLAPRRDPSKTIVRVHEDVRFLPSGSEDRPSHE